MLSDRLAVLVVGLIAVGVLAYAALRAVEARRLGRDPARAAVDALRDVGPPAILAGVAVVAAYLVAGALAVLVLVALFSSLFGADGGGDLTGLLLLVLVGGLVVLSALCGAVVWAVQRIRRRSRG